MAKAACHSCCLFGASEDAPFQSSFACSPFQSNFLHASFQIDLSPFSKADGFERARL